MANKPEVLRCWGCHRVFKTKQVRRMHYQQCSGRTVPFTRENS